MKQNPTIYKIDSTYDFEQVHEKILSHLISNDKITKERDVILNEYECKLIVIESDDKDSEWSNFFPNDYVQDLSLEYKMPSLVLLIKTTTEIYAIVGGAFFKYVLPVLDMSYGLNTYARIMDPTKDQIITIKTRGVTGLRAGMQEQFKDNYRIMDYIKFGKIPTELKIKLSEQKVDLLFSEFVSTKSPHIILNISSGFNINKKLSFSELGKLIDILVYLETQKANDFFSSYKEIVNKDQISNLLKPAVINTLFQQRNQIINQNISNFEICYPNKIEDFYGAERYEVKIRIKDKSPNKIAQTSDKSEILRLILKHYSENNLDRNLNSFSHSLYNTYILTYKNGKRQASNDTALIYHLNTELYVPEIGNVIYLDAKWYKLREKFINEMNIRCLEIINETNLKNSILSEKWTKDKGETRETESSYNGKYNKNSYLVLDEIIVDSIELADVIYIKSDTIYLCHIKYGFSTEMRELYSQMISSARRLKHDINDQNTPYLKSIYTQLVKKNRIQEYNLEDFLNLFRSKKIEYVMGISSHLKNRTLTENIEKYKSNIAKLSLIQCYTEMRTEYYDMHIELIDNSECFN